MATITETVEYEPGIYQVEVTDYLLGGEGGTLNIQPGQLANRTAYLKVRSDDVDGAKGTYPTLTAAIQAMQASLATVDTDAQNAIEAAVQFALTQTSVNGWGVKALRQQAQQEGQITLINRGVVSGCALTASTTAARNLNVSGGACFAQGRAFAVASASNAASVPSNTGTSAVVVYAYLYQAGDGSWHPAVTAIGQTVPAGGITIYNVTIPPNSTDATDPNLTSVTLTDMRRIEAQFPMTLDNAPITSVPLNILRANDWRVDYDVVSYEGPRCVPTDVITSSRATNGFALQLASAADSVVINWRVSKLDN